MGKSTNVKLRTEYRSLFGHGCEVWPYMTREERQEVLTIGANSHIDIHHICRLGGRHDYWGNMIGICAGVHHWGHNGMEHNEDRLKVLCIYSKFAKSRMERCALNPYPEREFNIEELNRASGKRILGVLENYTQQFPEESHYFQMCRLITEAQDH